METWPKWIEADSVQSKFCVHAERQTESARRLWRAADGVEAPCEGIGHAADRVTSDFLISVYSRNCHLLLPRIWLRTEEVRKDAGTHAQFFSLRLSLSILGVTAPLTASATPDGVR
jgi:hypothetical protein